MPDTYQHPGADYRDRLPASIASSFTGPRGEPCFTTVDRRWLWRLESFLAVYGTNDAQRQMGYDLQAYLRETCQHHWMQYEVEQCLWCNALKDGWPAETEQPQCTCPEVDVTMPAGWRCPVHGSADDQGQA